MNKQSLRSGFTLMETLLSITILAILLSTFLAVFGPATNTIRRAISIQDADRLSSALEKELTTLREDETGQFNTPFDKAFDWIASSGSLSDAVVLFNYRGDVNDITDGILAPYTDSTGSSGSDYQLQSVVRRAGSDGDLEELLEAVEGRAFVVRMRQLVRDGNGDLSTSDDSSGIVGLEGGGASSAADFEDAVVAFQADFFAIPANSFAYISGPMSQGGTDFEGTLGDPLFSRPLAVRR